MDLALDSPPGGNTNCDIPSEAISNSNVENVVKLESCPAQEVTELSRPAGPYLDLKRYFQYLPQKKRKICTLCSVSYGWNTSSTNLKMHMKIHHMDVVRDICKSQGFVGPQRVRLSTAPKPGMLGSSGFTRERAYTRNSFNLNDSCSLDLSNGLDKDATRSLLPQGPSTPVFQTSQLREDIGELKAQLKTMQAAMGTLMGIVLKKDSGPDVEPFIESSRGLAPDDNYDEAWNLMMVRCKGLKEILEDPAIASRTSSEARFLTNLIQNFDDGQRLVREMSERARLLIAAHYYGWFNANNDHDTLLDTYKLGDVDELKKRSLPPEGIAKVTSPWRGPRRTVPSENGANSTPLPI